MTKKNLSIGIVGFGRFGTLAASVLSKHFNVKAYNPHISQDTEKRARLAGVKLESLENVASSDVVVLCAPISETEELIQKIAPMLKQGSLVMDTCSVKVYPTKWLKKYIPQNVQIMATHPMFGPVTSKFDLKKQFWQLDGLQIVLCPIRIDKKSLALIRIFLKKLELEIIETTPEDHDKQNATTLGLVHFLGRSLLKAGIRQQKIYTPGYADLLKILPHTTGDNWQLFYDMHNYNPYAGKTRRKFMDACEFLDEKIKKNNI